MSKKPGFLLNKPNIPNPTLKFYPVSNSHLASFISALKLVILIRESMRSGAFLHPQVVIRGTAFSDVFSYVFVPKGCG